MKPIKAAVLVPLIFKNDDWEIVIIERSRNTIHGGELAFPGGKHTPSDSSLLDTAFRESKEEINLNENQVREIIPLAIQTTQTSLFEVHPFIGILHSQPEYILQTTEVSRIFQIPLSDLSQQNPLYNGTIEPCCFVEGQPLWGLSFRVLISVLESQKIDFLR